MTDLRRPVFEAVRDMLPGNPFANPANITKLDNALDAAGVPRPAPVSPSAPSIGHNAPPAVTELTLRTVMEIVDHEGMVLEAYKDSKGIWTWGIGVTDASGHEVGRYKDKPATIERVLEIYIWLLRTRYLPGVLRAFEGHPLAEHELAAALSFHYNTGAIGRADWVKDVVAGRDEQARSSIMNWRSPPEIVTRRRAEQRLFFEGRWSSDNIVPVYGVSKPSYQPRGARMIDIRADLQRALEGKR